MGDPYFTQEQAEAAKVIASGGFGAAVLIHLRHPGSAVKAGTLFMIGCGNALIFTNTVVAMLPDAWHVSEIPVAAALGLLGKSAASKALNAFERFDLLTWFERKLP